MISIRKPLSYLFLLVGLVMYSQNQFIKIGKDSIDVFIEDMGEGKPVVFIPGWTMTTEFFVKQKEHFGEKFRFISYDPRSHGKSSKTKSGHTYKTHAADLNDIINNLELHDVVLVGWSSGCATIYEYVKLFGTQNLSHLVFIDEPPKWIGDITNEWVYGTFEDYRGSLRDLIEDRDSYAVGIANWMTQRKLDSLELKWMLDQMLLTPNDVALSLYIDGMVSDYNSVLIDLNAKIPMLFMVRNSWYQDVLDWLKINVPDAQIVSIASHAYFYEEPEDFNKMLETFIKRAP